MSPKGVRFRQVLIYGSFLVVSIETILNIPFSLHCCASPKNPQAGIFAGGPFKEGQCISLINRRLRFEAEYSATT